MRVVVKKWGNSASLRIPSAVMKAVPLSVDDAVDVREEEGRIVVEPLRRREFSLKKLLADVTPENRHGAVDFGGPVGKEIL